MFKNLIHLLSINSFITKTSEIYINSNSNLGLNFSHMKHLSFPTIKLFKELLEEFRKGVEPRR